MGERSNGVQDGITNACRFEEWQRECSDFKPYIFQGALSVKAMARECGLNRDVFYTNPEIRDRLLPDLIQRLERDGVLAARVANPAPVVPRVSRRSVMDNARIKQIQEENEALKAENRELRRRLEKLGGLEEILQSTGRLPW